MGAVACGEGARGSWTAGDWIRRRGSAAGAGSRPANRHAGGANVGSARGGRARGVSRSGRCSSVYRVARRGPESTRASIVAACAGAGRRGDQCAGTGERTRAACRRGAGRHGRPTTTIVRASAGRLEIRTSISLSFRDSPQLEGGLPGPSCAHRIDVE